MTENSRSPIKDKPLRLPGQSLSEERARILEDKLLLPLSMATFLVVMAGLEWFRYLVPQRPNPWLMSVIALTALAFLAWRIIGRGRR
jgi:hypothetical protein